MNFPQGTNYLSLVIDQGNTLIKIALFAGDHIQWVNSYSSFDKEVAESLEIPEGAAIAGIISSVSASPQEIIDCFNKKDNSNKIHWIILNDATPVPVVNNYMTPETLGKDRLAGVVAASSIFPDKDVLVIDAGTAITYDLITRAKEYFGGSISPGLGIRLNGLHTFTGRLPLIEKAVIDNLYGRNTEESILTGVMNGAVYEIEGFINSYIHKYPQLTTVLTGGDAIYFDGKLKSNIFAIPNLVLNGLNLILRYNLEK